MSEPQNTNEAACGGSALTAVLGAELYGVMVGVKCYGSYRDKDMAVERAKFWCEKYPEAHVTVQKRATVWSDGKTLDFTKILRGEPVPNSNSTP